VVKDIERHCFPISSSAIGFGKHRYILSSKQYHTLCGSRPASILRLWFFARTAAERMDEQARETPPPVRVLVDEKDAATDSAVSSGIDAPSNSAAINSTSIPATSTTTSSNLSPPASPPVSPPPAESRRSPGAEDYYSSRPRHDRLGNPIPQRRQGAMSSVFGDSSVRLPGDLGAKDPRRPKSPKPTALPGDLGPNDPRKSRSTNSSPAPGHVRHESGGSPAPREGERILKDPKRPSTPLQQDDHQDSDDDADADNDNDTDGEDSKRGRGRIRPEPGRTTSGKSVNVRDESEDSERESKWPGGVKPDPTKGESKLSFKGESNSKVTGSGEKKRVHPMSAFDAAPSGRATPATTDDESHHELRAAQKLALTMSEVYSTPSAHRVIRQIVRGDYGHFQREAEEGRRRQRMYLVATDISPEAEHALEWTIGTVLRDGDTLFAVYAGDEEAAGGAGEGGVEIGRGADMVRDTAAIVQNLPSTNVQADLPRPSPLGRAENLAAGSSTDIRSRSRNVYSAAEAERRRVLEDVTARCIRMLRKTRLQCRVVVEVFHCKVSSAGHPCLRQC